MAIRKSSRNICLYALLQQEDGLILKLIEKMDIQKEHFLDNEKTSRSKSKGIRRSGYVGQDLNNVLIHAEDEAKQMGDEYVSVEHLFLALLKYPNKAMKEIFKEYGITRERFPPGTVNSARKPESCFGQSGSYL